MREVLTFSIVIQKKCLKGKYCITIRPSDIRIFKEGKWRAVSKKSIHKVKMEKMADASAR